MKLTLKAPGSKRLKLEYDDLLSNVAVNFNVRRYNQANSNKEEKGKVEEVTFKDQGDAAAFATYDGRALPSLLRDSGPCVVKKSPFLYGARSEIWHRQRQKLSRCRCQISDLPP
jgi:hypothetical protein